MPAINASTNAEMRTQSVNNMKQIAIAMLNHESARRHFPRSVVIDNESAENGSWRVKTPPHLEQVALCNATHKNELWDSPAKRKLSAQMPEVFAVPDFRNTQETPYQSIVSEDGALTPHAEVEVSNITEIKPEHSTLSLS